MWALQYSQDIVVMVMSFQSRIISTVQEVFPQVSGLLAFMDHTEERLKSREGFKTLVLMDDEELHSAYKDCQDKAWVKDGIVAAIVGGRNQLLKNWGSFKLKANGDPLELHLEVSREGDVFRKPQLSFFALASLLDPRKRASQTPPSKALFLDGIPWDIEDNKIDTIIKQWGIYLIDDSLSLPEDGNLRLFWSSLERSNRKQYGVLSRFAIRVLNVPAGSAEVERAVSAYNNIVTEDRASLGDERARDYVMIYANNPRRKEKNARRAARNLERQKKKKDERLYIWKSGAFEPKSKKSKVDE